MHLDHPVDTFTFDGKISKELDMLTKLRSFLSAALAWLKSLPAMLLGTVLPASTMEWVRLALALLLGAKLHWLLQVPLDLIGALARMLWKLL